MINSTAASADNLGLMCNPNTEFDVCCYIGDGAPESEWSCRESRYSKPMVLFDRTAKLTVVGVF